MVGTVNLTNPGVISHNEILEMYKEYIDPSFKWTNFSIKEQRQILACDRSNNLLDTSRLESFAPYVRSIKDAVRETIKNYKPSINSNYISNTIETTDFQDEATTLLFVTGGAGFIGSNFINHFFKHYKQAKIINFDALYYCANEKKNIQEDIRNNKER